MTHSKNFQRAMGAVQRKFECVLLSVIEFFLEVFNETEILYRDANVAQAKLLWYITSNSEITLSVLAGMGFCVQLAKCNHSERSGAWWRCVPGYFN